MTERDSEVPRDLQVALENTPTEINWTKPLNLLPPEEWPPCPECGDRLSLSSVATGAGDEVLAARFLCQTCPAFEHTPQFVLEVATGELHFDGAPEPKRAFDDTDF